MKNLDKAISSLKLENLKTAKISKASNLIEPTEAEIKSIVSMLVEGKEYKEIKKSVRRVVKKGGKQVSAQGFSYGQIKQIDIAREAKASELSAPKEKITAE